MSCGHIAPSDVHCTSLCRFQTPSVFCRRGELWIQMTHRSRFSWVLTSRYSVERTCSGTAVGLVRVGCQCAPCGFPLCPMALRPGSSVGHHCFASQIHVVSLFGQCRFRLRCHTCVCASSSSNLLSQIPPALLAAALFCTCPPCVALPRWTPYSVHDDVSRQAHFLRKC